MGRRSDHSKEEIHAMSLAAARSIIESEGFAGLSARKIATKIGYTVGTLYLVFRNLDDLISQVNAQTLDELYFFLNNSVKENKAIKNNIHALGRAYIQFGIEHQNLWSAIFEHKLPDGEKFPDWFLEKALAGFTLVEQALLPYAENKSKKDLQILSRALWGGVHGICVLGFGGKANVAGVDSIHILTDTLINTFLAGLDQH